MTLSASSYPIGFGTKFKTTIIVTAKIAEAIISSL